MTGSIAASTARRVAVGQVSASDRFDLTTSSVEETAGPVGHCYHSRRSPQKRCPTLPLRSKKKRERRVRSRARVWGSVAARRLKRFTRYSLCVRQSAAYRIVQVLGRSHLRLPGHLGASAAQAARTARATQEEIVGREPRRAVPGRRRRQRWSNQAPGSPPIREDEVRTRACPAPLSAQTQAGSLRSSTRQRRRLRARCARPCLPGLETGQADAHGRSERLRCTRLRDPPPYRTRPLGARRVDAVRRATARGIERQQRTICERTRPQCQRPAEVEPAASRP